MASADVYQQDRRSRRAWRLGAVVALGAMILAGRLFDLQVLGVQDYTLQSERNRIRREFVTAPRGLIVDHDGVVLADSRPSYTVLAVPRRMAETPSAITVLAEILRMEPESIRERLDSGPSHLPRVVRHDVGFEQVSRIAERDDELPGVSLEVQNVRTYPRGSLAAHLLGHVGEISEREVKLLADRGYRAGDFLGRTGLERMYERELRGTDGERYLEVDARGRVVGRFHGRDPSPPLAGRTIHLHLDSGLQATAESLLVGWRGTICLLEPRTGGVLALASSPGFDPNLFATGIGARDWDLLNTDEDRPLLNRAVQATYPPGSTFKIVSFVLTSEERVVGWRDVLETPCVGGYRFGNRWFGCWEEAGHGSLDLQGALVRSCDTYFYQIAEEISVDDLAGVAKAAGLGAPTGIDLPQELSGNVPTAAWLDERYGSGRWTQGNVLNLIIGQGEYLVTPLQMARLIASIATDGDLMAPQIVEAIEEPGGKLTHITPRSDRTWKMSGRTLHRLQETLRLVVADSTGTGRGCRVEGWSPAAKTGTAENPHGEAHSWFIGYAPHDDPRVAFCVIVEHGGHGSDVALPMARTLLRELAQRDGEGETL